MATTQPLVLFIRCNSASFLTKWNRGIAVDTISQFPGSTQLFALLFFCLSPIPAINWRVLSSAVVATDLSFLRYLPSHQPSARAIMTDVSVL